MVARFKNLYLLLQYSLLLLFFLPLRQKTLYSTLYLTFFCFFIRIFKNCYNTRITLLLKYIEKLSSAEANQKSTHISFQSSEAISENWISLRLIFFVTIFKLFNALYCCFSLYELYNFEVKYKKFSPFYELCVDFHVEIKGFHRKNLILKI